MLVLALCLVIYCCGFTDAQICWTPAILLNQHASHPHGTRSSSTSSLRGLSNGRRCPLQVLQACQVWAQKGTASLMIRDCRVRSHMRWRHPGCYQSAGNEFRQSWAARIWSTDRYACTLWKKELEASRTDNNAGSCYSVH